MSYILIDMKFKVLKSIYRFESINRFIFEHVRIDL